jgi:F420-dependent methylenetetrahydromethanopterin dehydrogenase
MQQQMAMLNAQMQQTLTASMAAMRMLNEQHAATVQSIESRHQTTVVQAIVSNFRMLELPSLDAPMTRGARISTNELEELLSQVVETVPPTRAGRLRTSASREWTTAQVELCVRRQLE